MPLTWTEIRRNAVEFVREWSEETRERAEAQSFWNDFFKVFGLNRRRLASFEEPVRLLAGRRGNIDLFWKGTLLVEHKSRDEDLDAAYTQAVDYFHGIDQNDLPKYVLVSDFARFRLYDLEAGTSPEFAIEEFPEKTSFFGFVLGQNTRVYSDAAPVNGDAAELMAELHDALKENGYIGHPLEVFLVRLMFCLFADYTGIFEPKNQFRYYIEQKTRPDGADCGMHIREIFSVLDCPADRRQRHLDEDLKLFPYVNRGLFHERFDSPTFDRRTRDLLLKCCSFDWSAVSPAVFGSMFQLVMQDDRRRNIQAHYTSEKNILKVIRSLFLDELRAEFEMATTHRQLSAMLENIAQMKILDPACGCGNFLIISYRELRQLEIDIHKKIRLIQGLHSERLLSIDFNRGIDVDAMYGIEIEEFPTRVAETALYIVDHQMNVKASLEFGQYFTRLPLQNAPNIRQGNALTMEWNSLVEAEELSCVLGNPPFISKQKRDSSQRDDMDAVFGNLVGHNELDYVACWFIKASRFIRGMGIRAAFVATNSITQGEQVAILWGPLLRDCMQIQFAHRTFRWRNDAPGVASVFCVIVGMGDQGPARKLLFDYQTPDSDPIEVQAANINPYLVDAPNILITKRRSPLCQVPRIRFGSMPNDGGHLLLDQEARDMLISEEPRAALYIRRIVGSVEYINDIPRWCLWLVGIQPAELRALPRVIQRVESVRRHRLASNRPETRRLADTPTLFGEDRQPTNEYIVIPGASSEMRKYIPIGFLPPEVIASNLVATVDSNDRYVLGVLTSSMHMAWVRAVCGRLKSDYRYSNEIVYNNFPWAPEVADARRERVRECAREVLQVRERYLGQSLAALYDPVTMPPDLTESHRRLDRAADACYRSQPFAGDSARQKFLFDLYEQYIRRGQLDMLNPPRRPKRRPKGTSN